MVAETGAFVQTKFTWPCRNFEPATSQALTLGIYLTYDLEQQITVNAALYL